MKVQVDTLDAVPSKRLFLSIIADYDLQRSICELVDNGLDVWIRNDRKGSIHIKVLLDTDQQRICVEDNAGGLPKAELRYIVGPGQTGSSLTDETIGIFGVGTKRAVVALAQDVRISTRHKKDLTYQVDFDDNWLAEESWALPLYQVDDLPPGTTLVELQRLRMVIDDGLLDILEEHLRATYAKFLSNEAITISLNGSPLTPVYFDNWSYPPDYEPRRYVGTLVNAAGKKVRVEALAGLSNESSPAAGEYGVYFYCNDRLVARALKTFDVGFLKGYAGLPHPKISLTKVIVSLKGDASLMPWNSSKSDISTKHEIFQALHSWLTNTVKDFAQLSRIWVGEWEDQVFKFNEGKIVDIQVNDFPAVKKSYLPSPPKSRPRFADVVATANQKISKIKPWVRGLYEGVIAADLISRQSLEQKNRISLIVLDSTIEIAFKDYLVNDSGTHYSDAKLLEIFATRHKVHTEMKKYVTWSDDMWKQISHFSNIRNGLIHRRASGGVSDIELAEFRGLVEDVLKKLYKLKF